jgi:hypothetical protein
MNRTKQTPYRHSTTPECFALDHARVPYALSIRTARACTYLHIHLAFLRVRQNAGGSIDVSSADHNRASPGPRRRRLGRPLTRHQLAPPRQHRRQRRLRRRRVHGAPRWAGRARARRRLRLRHRRGRRRWWRRLGWSTWACRARAAAWSRALRRACERPPPWRGVSSAATWRRRRRGRRFAARGRRGGPRRWSAAPVQVGRGEVGRGGA